MTVHQYDEIVHEETYHGCEIMVVKVPKQCARPYRVYVNGDRVENALRPVSSAKIETAVDYGKRHVRSLNSERTV